MDTVLSLCTGGNHASVTTCEYPWILQYRRFKSCHPDNPQTAYSSRGKFEPKRPRIHEYVHLDQPREQLTITKVDLSGTSHDLAGAVASRE
jgi:hypothetical protein